MSLRNDNGPEKMISGYLNSMLQYGSNFTNFIVSKPRKVINKDILKYTGENLRYYNKAGKIVTSFTCYFKTFLASGIDQARNPCL